MVALGWFAERILFADVAAHPVAEYVLDEEWFELLSIGLLFALLLVGTVLGLLGVIGRVNQTGEEDAKRADRWLALAGSFLYAFCMVLAVVMVLFMTVVAMHYRYVLLLTIVALWGLIGSLIARICRKKKLSFILFFAALLIMAFASRDDEVYIYSFFVLAIGLAACAIGALFMAILYRKAKSDEVRGSSAAYLRYAADFGLGAGLAFVVSSYCDTYDEKTAWTIAGAITALCLWGLGKRKLAALAMVLTEALILWLYYTM